MDVNGTRMKLLLGRRDWAACSDGDGRLLGPIWDLPSPGKPAPVTWDGARSELTLQPEPFEFPPTPLQRPPGLADRRGAGRDVYGNWYWIGRDSAEIMVLSAGDGSTSRFWPIAVVPDPARVGTFTAAEPRVPVAPAALAGAAVTDDHFLAVGALDPPGMLVFDLQAGGPPMHLPWPPSAPFKPFEITRRPGGGVFVLDVVNRLAWELDRHFHVVPAVTVPEASASSARGFASLSGSRSQGASPALTSAQATAVAGTPISIEAAPGGGLIILDGAGSLVTMFRDGTQVGPAVPLTSPALPQGITVHDMALVGATLFVVDGSGNQAFAFEVAFDDRGFELTLSPAVYPMRRYGGKGLVAAGNRAYYDFADRWIPLVAQPVQRYPETGTVVTSVLDSGIPGCQWHRLLLDARIPSDTAIHIWSIAADDQDALGLSDWRPEPTPVMRRSGSEIPFVDSGPYATHELLLQAARGRYLRVKLELSGTGRTTPRVRALRAWFPRFSYLEHYLPGVYREDPDSASFLDRYLANVEGLLTAVEARIAASQVLLDPRSSPADALQWLAGWLTLSLDPLWDERRRRLFIAGATRFYQARGTIRAIEMALAFALDPCVQESVFDSPQPAGPRGARIVEYFRTRMTPGVVFGDPTSTSVPRQAPSGGRWTPDQGRDALSARYASYLRSRGLDPGPYPPADPQDATSGAWKEFSVAVLGFVPVTPDPAQWQTFIASRYPNPGVMGRAYRLAEAVDSFASLEPPPQLPHDGAALSDWFQYQTIVLPMRRTAHRFTVMLPWPLQVPDGSGDQAGTLNQSQLRDLASRIVELQKPAHTVFDVKFFWAAFRVGEVRLGFDTQLASGSRIPELLEPALLGREYLGTSYLAGHTLSTTAEEAQ